MANENCDKARTDAVKVWQDIMKDATDQMTQTFEKMLAEKDGEICDLLRKMVQLETKLDHEMKEKVERTQELEDKLRTVQDYCEFQENTMTILLNRKEFLEKEFSNHAKIYGAMKIEETGSPIVPKGDNSDCVAGNSLKEAGSVIPTQITMSTETLPGNSIDNLSRQAEVTNEQLAREAATSILRSNIRKDDTSSESPIKRKNGESSTGRLLRLAAVSLSAPDLASGDHKYRNALNIPELANEIVDNNPLDKLTSSALKRGKQQETGAGSDKLTHCFISNCEEDDTKHADVKFHGDQQSHLDWHLDLLKQKTKRKTRQSRSSAQLPAVERNTSAPGKDILTGPLVRSIGGSLFELHLQHGIWGGPKCKNSSDKGGTVVWK